MNTFFKKNLSFYTLPVVFLLITTIVATQKFYDEYEHPVRTEKYRVQKYVLPPTLIKHLSFGFSNTVADYYWVMIIQDFIGWNSKDSYYVEEYRNLFTLDPHFEYPYIFAILTIPSFKHRDPEGTKTVEEFAKIGIANNPHNWEIPFYMATAFQLSRLEDKVLPYLEIAVSRPRIPDLVKKTYDLYKNKKLSEGKAGNEFIKTIYSTSNNKTTKDIIKQGVALSQAENKITELSQKYKSLYGIYPKTIDDMINKNLVSIEPALIKRVIILIDQSTGEATVIPKSTKNN